MNWFWWNLLMLSNTKLPLKMQLIILLGSASISNIERFRMSFIFLCLIFSYYLIPFSYDKAIAGRRNVNVEWVSLKVVAQKPFSCWKGQSRPLFMCMTFSVIYLVQIGNNGWNISLKLIHLQTVNNSCIPSGTVYLLCTRYTLRTQ